MIHETRFIIPNFWNGRSHWLGAPSQYLQVSLCVYLTSTIALNLNRDRLHRLDLQHGLPVYDGRFELYQLPSNDRFGGLRTRIWCCSPRVYFVQRGNRKEAIIHWIPHWAHSHASHGRFVSHKSTHEMLEESSPSSPGKIEKHTNSHYRSILRRRIWLNRRCHGGRHYRRHLETTWVSLFVFGDGLDTHSILDEVCRWRFIL